MNLREKAQKYWVDSKLKNFQGKKKFLFHPIDDCEWLRVIGIMNSDASISADNYSKFLQVNHKIQQIMPILLDWEKRNLSPTVIDLAAGNSYLSFALYAYWKKQFPNREIKLICIENRADLINSCQIKAQTLNWGSIYFVKQDISQWQNLYEIIQTECSIPELKVNMVLALHACNTATDFSIAFAIKNQAHHVALVPCCQSELFNSITNKIETSVYTPLWNMLKEHSFIGRKVASHLTDLWRTKILQAYGYKVTTTEFVDSEHTDKNTLILAHRMGKYHLPACQELEFWEKNFPKDSPTLSNLVGKPVISN